MAYPNARKRFLPSDNSHTAHQVVQNIAFKVNVKPQSPRAAAGVNLTPKKTIIPESITCYISNQELYIKPASVRL